MSAEGMPPTRRPGPPVTAGQRWAARGGSPGRRGGSGDAACLRRCAQPRPVGDRRGGAGHCRGGPVVGIDTSPRWSHRRRARDGGRTCWRGSYIHRCPVPLGHRVVGGLVGARRHPGSDLAPWLPRGDLKEHEAPPPRHPFMIMNPRSGGGKVGRFGLVEKAEAARRPRCRARRPGGRSMSPRWPAKRSPSGADLLGGGGRRRHPGAGRRRRRRARPALPGRDRRHPQPLRARPRPRPRRSGDAWTRSPTESNYTSTSGASVDRPSSTTPRSAPTPKWCRAPPTATTRPAPTLQMLPDLLPGRGASWRSSRPGEHRGAAGRAGQQQPLWDG